MNRNHSAAPVRALEEMVAAADSHNFESAAFQRPNQIPAAESWEAAHQTVTR